MAKLIQDPLNLVVTGVGGQGNVLISNLIAGALNRKGYYVTVGDTFGAAQRGGAVFSSLRISNKHFYGALIPEGGAQIVLGLEPLETLRLLQKYGNSNVTCITNTVCAYPGGIIAVGDYPGHKEIRETNKLINKQGFLAAGAGYPDYDKLIATIKDLSKVAWVVNATDIAVKLGLAISMNVVMAGALVGSGQVPLTQKDIEEELTHFFPKERLVLNYKALEAGVNAVKKAA